MSGSSQADFIMLTFVTGPCLFHRSSLLSLCNWSGTSVTAESIIGTDSVESHIGQLTVLVNSRDVPETAPS
jgi:hypothetical protein